MTIGPVISYPIPPYANVPIQAQFFIPSRFVISAISFGTTTTITTTQNVNFVLGQLVRLLIPSAYGSYQLNETEGYVISIPAANQVVVTINSTLADVFIASPVPAFKLAQPQILAIGDVNGGALNSSGRFNTGTFVPGAFINISPDA
jgi:hypothetical protein